MKEQLTDKQKINDLRIALRVEAAATRATRDFYSEIITNLHAEIIELKKQLMVKVK